MRRQINMDELAEFYQRIGAALWYLQHLENALVQFLTMKIVHERRCAGQKVAVDEGDARMEENRKLTMGPLIDSCVHRSLVESGDDLYFNATRASIFGRIAAIEQEASSLRDIIAEDLVSWSETHGVDMEAAQKQAKEAIRKLKGG